MTFKTTFILASTLVLNLLCASFTKIDSFSDWKCDFDSLGVDSLVVFDVDEVLITTLDGFIHPKAERAFDEALQSILLDQSICENATKNIAISKKQWLENQFSLSMLLPKRVLVEEEIVSILQKLQDRGVKVIALTSCPSGKFGVIPKVELWRSKHLNSLGIHFENSFPSITCVSFDEMKLEGKRAPLFYRGILFSKGYEKGEVLNAFLEQIEMVPSQIIFFDDLESNIQSCDTSLQEMQIPFSGIEYRGADSISQDVSKEHIQFQLEYLLRTKIWLDDKQVQSKMLSLK